MKPLHGNMKMADLIEVNYHLLAVLTRFGIEGGFGEKTVRDICEKNHLDTDTFLLICNVYTHKDHETSEEIADRHNISINTVITHRKNITRKTGIKTVAGLTVYAILNGYVDINSVK
jgi:hypothetical protein